jgi:aspartate aminotransferase/aminotransferase
VYSQSQIKDLARIAAEKNVLVLSDEIYERFCYDEKFSSVANYYQKVLVLRGFSKSYAMTGWRLGYVAAHKSMQYIIEEMAKLQQYTFVCAPTPFQKAAIAALDFDITDYIDIYRIKRDILYNGLAGKFELNKPSGAFYAFVKAPARTASEFVERAINNNVLVIPGKVFSEKDTHFRISYATSDEKIKQGIEILCSLC